MITEPSRPADPPTYPRKGTFADLLTWHLKVWGTRPGTNTSEDDKPWPDRGKPWPDSDFLGEIFGNLHTNVENQGNLLKNWTGRKKKQVPGLENSKKIANAILGNWPNFQAWRDDLNDARTRHPGAKKNPLKISVEACFAELEKMGFGVTGAASISNLPQRITGARTSSGIHDSAAISYGARDASVDRQHHGSAARGRVDAIIEELTAVFAGRSSELAIIDRFLAERMAGSNGGLLVITAPSGFGKSALSAQWCAKEAASPRRRIARHFCVTRMGETTTKPENVYASLVGQVADLVEEQPHHLRDEDILANLLGQPAREDLELILWLDGIDEANGSIDAFLPSRIGARICVIATARANDNTTPGYLSPWLVDGMAKMLNPVRLPLDKLSLSDTCELVDLLFDAHGLQAPTGLAPRIFNASQGGYTLFVRNMAEGAIDAVKQGETIDLGQAPESLRGYAEVELQRLETLDQWTDLQPLFAFLTIAKEAVNVAELPTLLGRRYLPKSFPGALRRWLGVHQEADQLLLSFAHPLLADVFGDVLALDGQRKGAQRDLCSFLNAAPRASWPNYAWRHLPQHMLQSGLMSETEALLTEMEFINERFTALGAEDCPNRMAADWMAWYGVSRRGARSD